MSLRARRRPGPSRAVVRLLGWAILLLLTLGTLACIARGADRPPDPRLEAKSRVPGFDEVAFQVQPASGSGPGTRYCGLLAETQDQRRQGLMGRRDLAGYDAMVFRFPSESTDAFWMRNVPVPLTVAWFDGAGRFVSSADMVPCPGGDCPLYHPRGPYRFAVEVLAGELGRLGIGPGAVLAVDGPCSRG